MAILIAMKQPVRPMPALQYTTTASFTFTFKLHWLDLLPAAGYHVLLAVISTGGKRGDYQNRSVLYCIRQLCTIISTVTDEQFLQFSGLGFVTLGEFHCA